LPSPQAQGNMAYIALSAALIRPHNGLQIYGATIPVEEDVSSQVLYIGKFSWWKFFVWYFHVIWSYV